MKNFSNKVKEINHALISQMSVFARELNGKYYNLGQGIPSFDMPDSLKKQLSDALYNYSDINKYSLKSGLPALRQEIAKTFLKTKGIEIDPEKEICVTNGAIEALFCGISAVLNEGDEVILFSPSYPPHIEQVVFNQAKPVFLHLVEDNGWKIDVKKLEEKITKKTKAIIICNPVNPTGTVFEKEDLIKIAEIAKKRDIFIISDETYGFLTYDNNSHFDLLYLPEIRDRLIACFSFSKEYAMTGLRIGFLYAPPNLLNEILKIHDICAISSATFAQYAALFTLTSSDGFVKNCVKEFGERRELTCQKLDELKDFFSYQKPTAAYFVFPKINFSKIKYKTPPEMQEKINKKLKELPDTQKTDDVVFCLHLLYEANVVTVPGVSFGPTGKGHLRISFCSTQEEITQAFQRIKDFLIKNSE